MDIQLLLVPFDTRAAAGAVAEVPSISSKRALPASIAFRGDVYLFERGDIVRCYCRTWEDRGSREVIHANDERWLTET